MNRMQEYDVVSVVELKRSDRPFKGSDGVRRPPKVGDLVTICHEYDANSISPVAVEMVADDGRRYGSRILIGMNWSLFLARDEWLLLSGTSRSGVKLLRGCY